MIVLTAFAILIVSDTAAALIGRKFGKHPFHGKSVEGTTAFFISALIVVAIAPKVLYLPTEYVIGAVAALDRRIRRSRSRATSSTTISASPSASPLVMWALYAVLLPALNIFALDGAG